MPPTKTSLIHNFRRAIVNLLPQGLKAVLRKLRTYLGLKILSFRSIVVKHLTPIMLISVLAVTLLIFLYTVLPQQVQFSFNSQSACGNKIILLPSLHRTSNHDTYELVLQKNFSVFGLDLVSRQACVTAKTAPLENKSETVHFSIFGNKLLQHSLKISASAYPMFDTTQLDRPVSAHEPIELALNKADAVFDYEMQIDQNSSLCTKNQTNLVCTVKSLGLEQGREYKLVILRKHHSSTSGKAYEGMIRTAEPVQVASTSLAGGSIVYEPLQAIHIQTNKQLIRHEGVTIHRKDKAGETAVAASAEFKGSEFIIAATQPLERRANFILRINNLYSDDGGQLNQPLEISFSTSGGPAVKSSNLKSSEVEPTQQIVINFDQTLSGNQNINSIISLTGSSGAVEFRARIENSRIVIVPEALARCSKYTIKLTNNLENTYGIKGDSAWSFSFRTRCATISTIGYSVGGRAIQAYRFGNGPSKIIFVGGMHGNEKSSYSTMSSWIDELENNPERIPGHRTIVVIPNSNPDGTAASRRTNSNNVDLNRNFPADDWTPGVYMPGPTFAPQGGGSVALSEPESKALAAYVQAQSPRLVLTYHAVAAVVIGNDSGDSNSLAATYASKSRYRVANDSHADDIFSYSTTGEFEDWLHDKLGVPALLIELATVSSNEFSRNRDALWAMAMLP